MERIETAHAKAERIQGEDKPTLLGSLLIELLEVAAASDNLKKAA